MLRYKYLLLTLILFGIGIAPVSAVCDYEEQAALNREVANVQANYEIVEKQIEGTMCSTDDGTGLCLGEAIQINLLNLSENFRAVITNDVYRNTLTYNYSNTDNGNVSFFITDNEGREVSYNPSVITYTIRIYASSETGCEGDTLRTITLRIPRYNQYSEFALCDSISDYYLCQRYVTYEKIDYDTFYEQVTEELEENEPTPEEELTWYERIWDFVVEHSTIFIIGGVVIVIGVGATVAYIIIRRRRDII